MTAATKPKPNVLVTQLRKMQRALGKRDDRIRELEESAKRSSRAIHIQAQQLVSLNDVNERYEKCAAWNLSLHADLEQAKQALGVARDVVSSMSSASTAQDDKILVLQTELHHRRSSVNTLEAMIEMLREQVVKLECVKDATMADLERKLAAAEEQRDEARTLGAQVLRTLYVMAKLADER